MEFDPGGQGQRLLLLSYSTGVNGAAITITGVPTEIVSVPATPTLNVVVGDFIFVAARADFTKGLTAGNTTHLFAATAGSTATIQFAGEIATPDKRFPNHGASSVWINLVMIAFRVTVGGTLAISQQGISAGSNSTVSANGGPMAVWHFRQQ